MQHIKTQFRSFLLAPERAFIILALFFGVLSVFLMPILSVPDENQHFQVEYSVFSADGGSKSPALAHELMLSDDHSLKKIKDHSYSELFTKKTSAKNDGVAVNTLVYVFDGKTHSSVFDLLHLPQAIGVLIGRLIYPSIGVMVCAGRIVNLALYITVLYFLIKHIRYGKWVLVFISCLPMMIQQAASLSYDPINFLAVSAWFVFVVNLFSQKSLINRRQIIIGISLMVFLFLTKANNLLLVLLLLGMPARHLTDRQIYHKVRNSRYWRLAQLLVIILVTCISALAIYILFTKLLSGHAFHPKHLTGVLMNTFFWGDLTLIDAVATGMVGFFSNFYYHLPVWIVVLAFITLTIILLGERFPEVSRRMAWISGGLFVGSILLISIGMYYAWAIQPFRLGPGAKVTDGIQGRYFTPLLLVLFPAFAYIQRYIKIVFTSGKLLPIVTTFSSFLLLFTYIAQTWEFFWK